MFGSSDSSQSEGGWGFGSFFSTIKKASTDITKMAADLVDKSANGAIKLYDELKKQGAEMVSEINAREAALQNSDQVVVPWLLPEFLDHPDVKEKLREEVLILSKDLDTFLNDVEGCEDEKYSPEKNSELIVQLREKDSRLQKARFLLVQRDNLIDDDHFWRHYLFHVFKTVDHYKQLLVSEQSSPLSSSENKIVISEGVSESPHPLPEKQTTPTPEEESSQDISSSHNGISNTSVAERLSSKNTPQNIHSSNETLEEPPIPIEAPKSTIPEVVETVEDIYDFDGLSDFEKDLEDVDLEDVDLEDVDMNDIDDIEKEILDEL